METILIVSGDAALRETMAEAAGVLGHPSVTAEDAGQAVKIIDRDGIELVITDMSLPDGDGLELMARARTLMPDTAFIILTGYGQEYSYSRIIGSGADDFIKKPFTTEEFQSKLRRIVDQKRLQVDNKKLLEEQARLNQRLSLLLEAAVSFTAELDVDRLFRQVMGKVTAVLDADRSSLYVVDWDKREIWTKVAEKVTEIRLPLGAGVAGWVAETGQAVNAPDVRELPQFNPEFDQKHRFRTKSMLCRPVRNLSGELIGVIQVMNSRGRECFDEADEAMLASLAAQIGIALENSLLHDEVRLSFINSIQTLSATVDARHPLTAGHSERVTEYSLAIAEEMCLPSSQIELLKYAATLHDIGKIGIRDEILLKGGKFTPEERAEMNGHTVKTRAILEKFRFPKSLHGVPAVACAHHERMDGRGYPDGLEGAEIPIGARIMAVADVFDALTSPRDYPKYTKDEVLTTDPMPLRKALGILKEDAGAHFDPGVVSAFLRCLPVLLEKKRGSHFSPEYLDGVVEELLEEILDDAAPSA